MPQLNKLLSIKITVWIGTLLAATMVGNETLADFTIPPDLAPQYLLPIFSEDEVVITVQPGGLTNVGGIDEFHLPDAAYYSIDFATVGNNRADVIAAKDGTVHTLPLQGKCSGEPNCIIIDHGVGQYTEYREFSFGVDQDGTTLPAFQVGDTVSAKQVLGSLRDQANKIENEHLHFQVLFDVNNNGPSPGDSTISISELDGTELSGKEFITFNVVDPVQNIAFRGDALAPQDSATGNQTAFSFAIGSNEQGRAVVTGGSSFTTDSGTLGLFSAGDGRMAVSGTDSIWTVNPTNSISLGESEPTGLKVGVEGTGTLVVKDGGEVTAPNARLGLLAGGHGSILVSDPNSTLDAGQFLGIGANSIFEDLMGAAELSIGGGARVTAQTTVLGANGTLKGDGTLEGNFYNRGGTISPGFSPGGLVFNGDFTFDSGLLEIEVGGTNPGEFDTIHVDGSATFSGGRIVIVFVDGFLPEAGDSLDFLFANNLSLFENVELAFTGAASGFLFDISPTSGVDGLLNFTALNDAVLANSSIAEPSAFVLFLLGLASVIAYARIPARTRQVAA